ncbi:hypothetical protein [Echinicola salinicaeni]|uniref:hypothetical protein n=1 Tax=Echinicola salinicaeni TaxID=2762757 RepID=UPI001E57885C|nr:hypothetical protein [Echinicola salinicaeni]
MKTTNLIKKFWDSAKESLKVKDILLPQKLLEGKNIPHYNQINFSTYPMEVTNNIKGFFDNRKIRLSLLAVVLSSSILFGCNEAITQQRDELKQFSGVYPHLAYYNNEGECGTGAVVPWAGGIWVITYGPHKPYGSSDKLYEVTPELEQIVHKESIGGTPANRMIHEESKQLFIGPYAIDEKGNPRVISYDKMPGRHTGNARHLTDPEHKIYYGTMEEGFYEVDVETLEVNELYVDGNQVRKKGEEPQFSPLLPGAHGKGLYSGQGVMVFSNNGEDVPEAKTQFDIEAGALAEWNGEDWKVVRRNQFVEITGPGGIHGNPNPETDPIWATGWDHRSVLLGVRDHKQGWEFYRLPKASHSYDGAHGWNTEWPRIRDIGTQNDPDYLMTMHGLFWDFPQTFSVGNTKGIRPRSAYLKVIGDYTRWNDQLVFGCDDSAQKEFLNKRKVKGSIEGPGQSNSNLWFTSMDKPDQLGPNTAEGSLYINENIKAGEASDPFLFAGWDQRIAWVDNNGTSSVNLTFQVDISGNGEWLDLKEVEVPANSSKDISFEKEEKGEWIRVIADQSTTGTIFFTYTDDTRFNRSDNGMFEGLASIGKESYSAGLLYGLGDNRRSLGILAGNVEQGKFQKTAYYELDGNMNLVKKEDPKTSDFIENKFAIPKEVVSVEESSVLVIDDLGRRWRFPLGNAQFDELTNHGIQRIAREVATERDLMNLHGTFYELPAENADGFAKVRPVSSHNLAVYDYASYRGLLVMTGIDPSVENSEHLIVSQDGEAAVWAGVIDDLWELGKPVGQGGPWKNTIVHANESSDPYLIGFYDKKSMTLSHDAPQPVNFTLEVEPIGHGPWMKYKSFEVKSGEKLEYVFPDDFQARWIRFSVDQDCKATSWLDYK